MISEKAAFSYALLSVPVALYPRSCFRTYFPLTDAEYGPESLLRLKVSLADYQEQQRGARGQQKAFLQLLIQGAADALAFLETHDLSSFDLMATIEAYYRVVEEYYQERLGFEWEQTPPVVVDYYPPPSQDADWFAVSGVPGGPRPGYPQGIYFLRRHMMPGVAELATLHENVHHIGMGSASKGGGYYRYFDEGCANFLAYLVCVHKNRTLDLVRFYRSFLQEINTELYEYPSFDRILATLVQRVGVAGLYRLMRRRLSDVTSLDWRQILVLARQGGEIPVPGELTDADLPPIVAELEEPGAQMVAQILYPDPVPVSPVAYLAYSQVADTGALPVRDLRSGWALTEPEAAAVVGELAEVYLWAEADGQLRLSGFHGELFHNTGLIRAAAVSPPRLGRPWLAP